MPPSSGKGGAELAGNGGNNVGGSGATDAASGGTSGPSAGGAASAGAAGGMLAAGGGRMGSGGSHPSGGSGFDTDGGSQDTGGTGSGGAGAGGQGSGGAGRGSGGAGNGGSGAGGKGGSGGSTSTTRWCDGQKNVLFCEDFDGFSTVDDLFNSWTSVSTTGGVFSFDTGAGVPSAPNALRVRTTAPYSVSTLAIKKLPAFTVKPSKIRVEFDLRIDAADMIDAVSGAAFAGILTGTKVSDGIIGLESSINPALTGPGLYAGYIDSSGADGETVFSTPWPPENQWLGRFAVEITYSSSVSGTQTGCVQIYVAGVKQIPTCQKLSGLLLNPPVVSVVIGIYSGGLGTTGDIQLRFDNLTVSAQ